jgi:hypothetical protein
VKLLRAVLANRALARLELAWAAATLGNWAFSIVLAVYAYRQGGTGAVALALVVRMLPSAAAAPYAAMLVDRHSRRAVLQWASVVRAAALVGAAVAVAAGAPFGVVLVFAAVFTIVNTAHRPAQAGLMPRLARTPTELGAANACWSAIDYVGFLLGGLAAGALVGLTGVDVAFGACAATLAVTALLVRTLPADPRPPPLEGQAGGLTELSQGLRTVLEHAEIRLLTGVYAVTALVQGIFDVLIVVAAIELLGLGESGVGWLNAAWGVGGVLGGVAALGLLGRGRLVPGLSAGLATAGAAFATIGAWSVAPVAFLALTALGIGFALAQTAHLTLTQRLAADDLLGRVFGVQETIEVVALGVGSLLAAALVGLLGVGGAMVAAGAVLPLVAALTVRRLAGTESGAPVSERHFGFVRRLPLFASLPVATLENLALRLSERSYAPGEPIVSQGRLGDTFYVIADGDVSVSVDGAVRGHQHPGDFFGEIALLHDVPRTATVKALGPVTALAIEREAFLAAVSGHARSAAATARLARERLEGDARVPS